MQKGSTLIETLIYLALFAIIIGGVLVSAYQIIEASTQSQENALIQEEGHFLVAKINWALTGAGIINEPAPGFPGTALDIDKYNYADNPIRFILSGADLAMQKGTPPGFPQVLNSESVKVENVLFTHTFDPLNGRPAELKAEFTVISKLTGQSQIFSTTKYLRK